MSYFTHILLHNVIPLSIIMSVGALLYRVFRLDIRTLSKLNFYLFSPTIMFKMLYESQMSAAVMLQVTGYALLFVLVLYALVEIVVRLRGYEAGMRSAMRNSVIFYNSANYAIPLNNLVFKGDPFTMSIQLIVMAIQSLLPNTYGIYSINAHKQRLRESLKTIAGMPVIYCIPVALALRGFHVPLPQPIYEPINYLSQAFVGMALLTLGVQLGSMKWQLRLADVFLSNALRLCVGPAVGFFLVWLLGFHGLMAHALVLSCAVPTSLSSVLLAVEFENEPEFASQAVFSSTVLSIFSVTIVIYLLQFVS